jgi:uncharacterized protein YjbI with pentapeptide repeats
MGEIKNAIKCGRYYAKNVNLAKSRFHNVNLSRTDFNDVNLSKAKFNNICLAEAKFHDINLSDIKVTAVQMGGASFRHVGLPDKSSGRQRPLKFAECDLNGSTFKKCNLSKVKIMDSNCSRMKINGVAVDKLLKAYNKSR